MNDSLSTTFAALADPTRRAILSRLLIGECSVSDLAEPFDMTLPAVSKHLRVLERAGLVTQRREAQWRHCRIEASPLREVVDWTESYRHLWEQRLDRLDVYLKQMKATDLKQRKTDDLKQAKEKRNGRKQRKK